MPIVGRGCGSHLNSLGVPLAVRENRRMVRIASLTALDAWLDERGGFGDGRLAGINRSEGGAVTLRLEENVRLGLRPGDLCVVEVHELVAEAPFAFEPPDRHDPDGFITAVSAAELD